MVGKRHIDVMISSTSRDLPDHRKHAMDACLRAGMFPVMMEHLPPTDADAITASLKMVDEAEIYVGVFAHRYGYIPKDGNPKGISITEMEYNRAVERGIPRLIFFIHDDHPIRAGDVETGDAAAKLKALKDRIGIERVAGFFKSPEDLRGLLIHALSPYRQPDSGQVHYSSDVPQPPNEYVAHPYVLLQPSQVVGRQAELKQLTDWATRPDSRLYQARILNIVAIGGMGKSTLTWKWFKETAAGAIQPLAGRIWWSFYESDAHFENFVIRSLAYVSRQPVEAVKQMAQPDREETLLSILNREPFLLVLDGLERLLLAYARPDAAQLMDDSVDGEESRLRKAADPRVGVFLRKLAGVGSSRVLISTRLYPSDLEDKYTGEPRPGCDRINLTGLTDEDVLELWRSFGISGARDELLPMFNAVGNHPLVIKALIGEIRQDRRAAGDFSRWRAARREFDPMKLRQVGEAMAHVLRFALIGLSDASRTVLQSIAAFRMPVHYDTIAALLVDQEGKGGLFSDELALDEALQQLEERGIVGWDKRANRYDLHPVVRSVAWGNLDAAQQKNVYRSLVEHFQSLPAPEDWQSVTAFEELTSGLELYNALIGLERHEDALILFQERLFRPLQLRLNAGHKMLELLSALYIDNPRTGQITSPVKDLARLVGLYNMIGIASTLSGQPGQATRFYQTAIGIVSSAQSGPYWSNLSSALRLSGRLREAEHAAYLAYQRATEKGSAFDIANGLMDIGNALAERGDDQAAWRFLKGAEQGFSKGSFLQSLVSVFLSFGIIHLRRGETSQARQFGEQAWQFSHMLKVERDYIRAARLIGMAELALGNIPAADDWLHQALRRIRGAGYIEQEILTLVGLAEVALNRGELTQAREHLDEVWEHAERGPYPLFHADALNILTQIERTAGNRQAAVTAATEAYHAAWCDGPPYAYGWGLATAKAHLDVLGAPYPSLPMFDPGRHEALPDVQIDLPGE